jgi:hypothetical protein
MGAWRLRTPEFLQPRMKWALKLWELWALWVLQVQRLQRVLKVIVGR